MLTGACEFNCALVRRPGASVVNGLRDGDGADPILSGVQAEHAAYVAALKELGLAVHVLDPLEPYPDSVFVEDVALVFSEGAILLNPGANSRQGEVGHIEPVLRQHFSRILKMSAGYADGGDVLVLPDRVIIGLSARTNRAGAETLSLCLSELGNRAVIAETPQSVLHYKTGCSLIDAETVIAVPAMAGRPEFSHLRVLVTPNGEDAAANLLHINGHVLIGSHYPKTQDLIESLGIPTIALPVAQIGKIDAGLSCMSLRWRELS